MLAVLLTVFDASRACARRSSAGSPSIASRMLRSYAMTATAITLRLMIPASMLLGLEFRPAYQVIAWISWMTNLALVEHLHPPEARFGRDASPLMRRFGSR